MFSGIFGIFSNHSLKITLSLGAMVFIFTAFYLMFSSIPAENIVNEITTEITTNATYDLSAFEVKTYKGLVNLEVLNEKVFKPLGFEVIYPTLPVATLRMTKFNEPICSTIFSEYLEVTEGSLLSLNGDSRPKFHENDFLMSGFSAFNKTTPKTNNDKANRPTNWSKISEMMELTKDQIVQITHRKETGVASLFSALRLFPVDGMTGLVVGSVLPWVEVMALQNGAQKILTVERNKLDIEEEYNDRLTSMHPVEFSNKWGIFTESFDFAVTFGFVERSGLGLYLEQIDPIGDLREVLKIKCVLKKGGFLYLGLPYGTDALQFKSHRIYGPIRLAMMFSGFKFIASFAEWSQKPMHFNTEKRHDSDIFNPIRYTFVLQKL